jgi:hypothetical protein
MKTNMSFYVNLPEKSRSILLITESRKTDLNQLLSLVMYAESRKFQPKIRYQVSFTPDSLVIF